MNREAEVDPNSHALTRKAVSRREEGKGGGNRSARW